MNMKNIFTFVFSFSMLCMSFKCEEPDDNYPALRVTYVNLCDEPVYFSAHYIDVPAYNTDLNLDDPRFTASTPKVMPNDKITERIPVAEPPYEEKHYRIRAIRESTFRQFSPKEAYEKDIYDTIYHIMPEEIESDKNILLYFNSPKKNRVKE